MEFKLKFFDPPEPQEGDEPGGDILGAPEDAKPVYLYTPEIKLAINVALAAERPLLISGPPGSGKTTLAINVARAKGWRYLHKTITSRTRVEDLQAGFDSLRRLNDSQLQKRALLPDQAYVDPQILWWAFDPVSARRRGDDLDKLVFELEDGFEGKLEEEREKRIRIPKENLPEGAAEGSAVVLLDEIDKADPDVPNDLLEPLDRGTFEVAGTGYKVERRHPVLVIITTNGERQLPPAFMRRCVVLALEPITQTRLEQIAKRHWGAEHKQLYEKIAERVIKLRQAAELDDLRAPSSAEYLNAVRACARLEILPGSDSWEEVDAVLKAAVWKHDTPPREAA